jgi:hypothetical protein
MMASVSFMDIATQASTHRGFAGTFASSPSSPAWVVSELTPLPAPHGSLTRLDVNHIVAELSDN